MIPATRRSMEKYAQPGLAVVDLADGTEYSATPGDYFYIGDLDEEILGINGEPMVLMVVGESRRLLEPKGSISTLEPLELGDRLLRHPDLLDDDERLILARAVRLGRGEQPNDCETCAGTGEVTRNADPETDHFDGPVTLDCEECGGTGWSFD